VVYFGNFHRWTCRHSDKYNVAASFSLWAWLNPRSSFRVTPPLEKSAQPRGYRAVRALACDCGISRTRWQAIRDRYIAAIARCSRWRFVAITRGDAAVSAGTSCPRRRPTRITVHRTDADRRTDGVTRCYCVIFLGFMAACCRHRRAKYCIPAAAVRFLTRTFRNWAFTRYDRRTDRSVRLVGQTVAEPPTSVNQINVAC